MCKHWYVWIHQIRKTCELVVACIWKGQKKLYVFLKKVNLHPTEKIKAKKKNGKGKNFR